MVKVEWQQKDKKVVLSAKALETIYHTASSSIGKLILGKQYLGGAALEQLHDKVEEEGKELPFKKKKKLPQRSSGLAKTSGTDRTLLLLSTRFLGQDQLLRMSRTLHRPAPDPLLRPIDRRYGQEGWYPRRDPTMRLAALDAERIPDRKGTSRCVMMTLHLGRGD